VDIASLTVAVCHGRTTNHVYVNLGRLVKEQVPEFERYHSQLVRPTTYFGYDAVGNLKFVTRAHASGRSM